MRNIKIETAVEESRLRLIHKQRMKIQKAYSTSDILGISLFAVSVLFVCADLLYPNPFSTYSAMTLNQALALLSFGVSSYFCFIGRFKIKHPDFVFSAYALQFLFILFVWLSRFNQVLTQGGM